MKATLRSLSIRNLALVENLEWDLASGFLTVTGETGAGKSVIVGALKLILGERADRSLIRNGRHSCSVEAIFQLADSSEIDPWLTERGLEACCDGELIIKRVIAAPGSGKQFINCAATTLSVLKELTEPLVDLHGPHDHQSLLSNEHQLELLDSFAAVEAERVAFEEAFRALRRLESERQELLASEESLERELDLLRHQVREIEAASIQENEEADLLERYTLACNRQRLTEISARINDRLLEADDSLLSKLTEIQRLFRDLERIDSSTAILRESNERAVIELEELARSVQQYAGRLEIDLGEAAELGERITLLESLKRKYGSSLSEVLAFGKKAAARLERIESREERIGQLAKEIQDQHELVSRLGEALSQRRKNAAPKLSAEITSHLRDLGFRKAGFEALLGPSEKPSSQGFENVEFLFAPNPGEPAKPLKSTASSGEISRVMLAVKSSLAKQDRVPLLVFDEIDANVGGEVAHAVAHKLRSLGASHQVICITHLPQVAAAGHAQYVVTKAYRDGRTVSELEQVKEEARQEEVARMLGGRTRSALEHAKALLAGAS